MKGIAQYKNIIATIIVVIIFVFIIKNLVQNNSVVMKKLEEQKVELEKGKELLLTWKENAKHIGELADNFIKDSSTFKMLVERQAQSLGITINSLVPSREEKDFYSAAKINIRGIADSFSNIVKFTNSLEDKNVVVDILRVRNDQEKRAIDITLKTFIMNE